MGVAGGVPRTIGSCRIGSSVAATATPWPPRVRFTVFCRWKPAQPRLPYEALNRAAMNVNRLLPVSGTGEATAANRARLAAMKAVWILSMLAQKFAGLSAC